MAEAVLIPVVLYDGECEVDAGSININHTFNFKQFQKTLKDTIGVSHNNNNNVITTYLVESNRSKSPSKRRKVLITGNVNVSALVREIRNCYFRVVLKRSRRTKPNKQNPVVVTPPVSSRYLIQLRQNQLDLIDNGVRDIHMMNGYFVYAFVIWTSYVYCLPLNASFRTVEESGGSRPLCKDCTEAEKLGSEAPFHLCVYDEVVADGFRCTAGPISPRR